MVSNVDTELRDWIAFPRETTFDSQLNENTSSWTHKPVTSDKGSARLPPPSPTTRRDSSRLTKQSGYSHPRHNSFGHDAFAQAHSPKSSNHSSLSLSTRKTPSSTVSQKRFFEQEHCSSTSSSSESEKNHKGMINNAEQVHIIRRGRSHERLEMKNKSATRGVSLTMRSTRQGTVQQHPASPSTRSLRSNQSSKVNKEAGRGRSGSRPPSTRNNSNTGRARSRSASLTRVTGPSILTSSNHSVSRSSVSRKPPSTLRTRQEMIQKNKGSSVSLGGSCRSAAFSDDGSCSQLSVRDTKIGRDITFGSSGSGELPVERKSATGRFMEKLFGDHVVTSQMIAGPGRFKHESRPRVLLAATVYNNTATNLWIATINTNQRGVARDPVTANRYLKAFTFSTEHEARESAIANAPPKMVAFSDNSVCSMCNGKFAVFRRGGNCRNCGVCVCTNCATTWPAKSVPETYNLKKEANLKVCIACHSLRSSFKQALLDGDFEEAVVLYGTGNVNLRTPFPVSNKKEEVMYPIHAAVEGGNIDILRWLLDDHCCPTKLVRTDCSKKSQHGTDIPIVTSKGRSMLGIAIDRVKVDIMRYLVVECGVSIYECIDLKNSLRALEATLTHLPSTKYLPRFRDEKLLMTNRWDNASFDEISEPSSLGVDEPIF